MTVTRWCESGKLPAIAKPYGKKTTYLVSIQAVELFKAKQAKEQTEKQQERRQAKPHQDYIGKWIKSMERGTLAGKVFSPRTVADYKDYANKFFTRHKRLTINTLTQELMRVPAHQYAKRDKLYKAMVCFAKCLIKHEIIDASFLDEAKALRPKRHKEPVRPTVNEEELLKALDYCKGIMDRVIVILLASTGIRASEACALTLKDIDFRERTLQIRNGKGGKSRKLGLPEQVTTVLQEYMAALPEGQTNLFLNRDSQPMDRHGLHRRLTRIGRDAGVKVTPHGLRRAFVTINANKGRSLVLLQRSCGHTNIKTTMGYCMTSEQEVIEAMKQWQ